MSGLAGLSVLVVEDERDGQEVVTGILNHFHMSTSVTTTAEEALDLLAHADYSAVIIDLALPGMDGIALMKALRSNPQTAHLPCVAVTAYHSSLVRKQAFDAGCNAYIPKPLDNTHLIQELERVIAG